VKRGEQRVNLLLVPVLVIGAATFALGWRLSSRLRTRRALATALGTGMLAALPALLFAAFYLHLYDDAVWFYELRALSGSELAAGPAGFVAGVLHGLVRRHDRLRKAAGTTMLPVCLLFLLAAPYLKMIFRPMDPTTLRDRWANGVCLQSSSHTCMPASAATMLRRFGLTATERELAAEAFTSTSGTEVWYIARALRRRGLDARFVQVRSQPDSLPIPSLAGTRLKGPTGIGHAIAILDGLEDRYVVADPLVGREVVALEALRNRYYFTGFFLVVTGRRDGRSD
jgi:hypothetical protein